MTTPTLPSARRPCILIVDDTPTNIDVLVNLLQNDYDLKVANRGARALRICEQDRGIDLVLLDVMMPEMDGFEVCRILRAAPATRDLPVIFLTAKTDFDLAMGGRNSAVANLHDACVAVFGIMKTRYRKDAVSSEVIAKLPTVDKTPAETLRRAQALSILWGKLPNPDRKSTRLNSSHRT